MKYDVTPCAKPRMTQKDKWNRRPATERYWAFKNEVKRLKLDLSESGASIIFMIPMPQSWSKKKKLKMVGAPHKQKPDLDNLIKGLGDAVYRDDSCISDICASKIWAVSGAIIIKTTGSGEIEK